LRRLAPSRHPEPGSRLSLPAGPLARAWTAPRGGGAAGARWARRAGPAFPRPVVRPGGLALPLHRPVAPTRPDVVRSGGKRDARPGDQGPGGAGAGDRLLASSRPADASAPGPRPFLAARGYVRASARPRRPASRRDRGGATAWPFLPARVDLARRARTARGARSRSGPRRRQRRADPG